MTTASAAPPDNSVCPRCGAGLRCGMVASDTACWCVQLPRIMRVPPAPTNTGQADISAASCYCPACLQQITDERQAKLLSPAPD